MLLGIAGHEKSGRVMAANYLTETYRFHQMAFADKMKESVQALFGFPQIEAVDKLNHQAVSVTIHMNKKEIGRMTWEEFLQRYGTESHRDVFGPNFWIDQMSTVDIAIYDRTVIPDVRFRNEAEWILQNRGHLIRIERGESEQEIEGMEGHMTVISNDGTIQEFKDSLDRYIDTIIAPRSIA